MMPNATCEWGEKECIESSGIFFMGTYRVLVGVVRLKSVRLMTMASQILELRRFTLTLYNAFTILMTYENQCLWNSECMCNVSHFDDWFCITGLDQEECIPCLHNIIQHCCSRPQGFETKKVEILNS